MAIEKSAGSGGYQKTSGFMLVFVVVCCLASFKLAYFLSDREYAEQKIRVDVANRNMAVILAESINHAFQQADILLRLMKVEWENSGSISLIHREFLRETLNAGMINHIGVTDAAGGIAFSAVKLSEPVNFFKRENFQIHMSEDAGRVLVSAAKSGGAESRPTLYVSRRLNGPNGVFAGIVLVGIQQDYLLSVFREMDLGEENSLTLLHTNGRILARIPSEYNQEAFTTVFKNHPSLSLLKSGAVMGEYEVPGADGIPRLGSFHQLHGYPVIALATTKQEAAFREVAFRRSLYRNVAAVFSFIIGLAVLLMWLQLRKQYWTKMDLRNREKELTFGSYHDALTGIYNRAYFYERIREAGPDTAVIMADLDGLKVVNDTFGHKMGDIALLETARIIGKCIPADAIVARMGGDEFAVVMPAMTKETVKAVCQAIRQAVDDYNDGSVIPLQLSMGFALAEDTEMTPEELLATADKWMYRKKLRQSGTHRSQFTNTLKEMLVARDFITEGHASRMTETTIALAKAAGLPSKQIPDMELFAYFHDIGKVGISDRILNKKGPLTKNERQEMQHHAEIGHRIASATDDLSSIADWVLKHHERWDGTGYPWGIAGKDIPIQCRILAITDAYDAMTSDRPYRKAISSSAALEELHRNAGTQFDPDLVKIFATTIQLQSATIKKE